MDFLTSTILSGVAYDMIKFGVILSADNLREKLKDWIIGDTELLTIATELNKLALTDEMSALAIEKRITAAPELKLILENIKPASEGKLIIQNHSGIGDNVGGDKIIN